MRQPEPKTNLSIDTRPRKRVALLRPDRLRILEKPFGWVPFRLLRSGVLGQLSIAAKLLYFFLALVADKRGMSFYSDPRIAMTLALSEVQIGRARAELIRCDLLSFDRPVYQLLSLPSPKVTQAPGSISSNTYPPRPDTAIQGSRNTEAWTNPAFARAQIRMIMQKLCATKGSQGGRE